jgi:2-phosphosulfolactate phosphatase
VRVRVAATPGQADVDAHDAAVVIDVLRATTTLTYAFARGARAVTPVASPAEADAVRRRHPEALSCGERDGLRVAGFDLGNSPDEYTAEVVAGKHLIFASTNGSLAMIASRRARRRVLGAFVNARAVVDVIAGEDEVALVCAGKLGQPSLEDLACAGWLCRSLEARGARIESAAARLALALAPADAGEIMALVQGSSHGRYLRALGPAFARDVETCAALDVLDRADGW